ncbi:MAG TPA: pilus assembly PilX N-terminal domain-containing protein [Candidatus Saccharimonadales bacterium]|nr:pilus assembly PilX N-terminal domain-containing protein [Candidatus Saccharimonadales bacterium]
MSTTVNRPIHTKESGMVAIMVTIILMIVISLIVLGFAQVARRDQRQSLDRQLSTQAFYAAEAGVNDALEVIKTAISTNTPVNAKTTCADNGSGQYNSLNAGSILDAGADVAYTCLMIDPAPLTLVYSDIGTTGTVVPVVANSGTIATIKLTWQSKTGGATPASGCPGSTTNAFVPTTSWTCGYGVLRFDIVPTGAAMTHSSLMSSTMAAFLVPINTAVPANIAYSTTGAGDLSPASCSNTNCTASITGLGGSAYYMRINSIYRDVSLQVSATNAVGNPVELRDAQALIDATGKAQDVLRRVQVRTPITGTSTNLTSDYALESNDAICKRFSVMDGSGGSPGFFQSSAGVGGTNPLCQ